MSSSEAEIPSGRISSHTIRNGVPSPLPSTSLSRDHIAEAFSKSPDNGGTLDLAHKGLTDVGESGAEELATVGREDGGDSMVVRIALAYNRLTTLPMAFALLSRLRYLVLKNNNFLAFPDVLTVMPSLEILDISRNKIKRFPSQPGSLVNLRVFSFVRNKIHRLPAYLTQFSKLTLFKADQNPIEWPPRSVMESLGNLDDPQVMAAWIQGVQKWIEDNSLLPTERKRSEDSVHQEQELHPDFSMDKSIEYPSHLTPSNSSFQSNALYHARSFSLESSTSAYFQLDRSQSQTELGSSNGVRRDWPPLDLNALPPNTPNSTSTSPSHFPERVFEASVSSTDDDAADPQRGQPIHGRNASYAGRGHMTSRNGLSVKKSLPDLRPAKLHLATSNNGSILHPMGVIERPVEFNGFSFSRNPTLSPQEHTTDSSSTLDRPAPAMDMECHSYFRRLSTLKPSVISKAIPEELLVLVDAVRGILFAVSQIYQTLQYYTVYAIDERLSAVLLKVLDPASVYMTQMINALDRFDSISRRTLPPPAVCRAVVEGCRDSVAVFGKAVGVLALQLKVLATHDDVRYTRQMLLVLYGAMSEIASSWQAMASRIEAVRPLLREARPPPVKSHTPSRSMTLPNSFASTSLSTAFSLSLPGQDSPRIPRANATQDSGENVKGRISRRHAGSFSYKDVEIGKMLPSYTEPLPLTAGVVDGGMLQTPVLRTYRRVAPPLGSAPPMMQNPDGAPGGTNGQISQRWDSHSRQGSQSSLNASSSSSSSLAFRAVYSDAPSNTSTLVDKKVIEIMSSVVDAAPAIWEMMDEILSEAQGLKEGLKVSLSKAKDVTERLRDCMGAMQVGAPTKESLRDDAHLFVKTVIQLSSAIKTHATSIPLSSNARNNMAKLTNATQELLILLHVSSFSPAATPRPYSPMVGGVAHPSPLGPPEDGRLGANLSRSRSALRPTPSKSLYSLKEPPHSAAPNQTFSIPTPPHFGPMRKTALDDAAAVAG